MFVLLALTVVGRVRLGRKLSDVRGDVVFAKEFFEHLKRFVESSGRDMEAYAWCTRNSVRMQRELGPYGWLEAYRPPFGDVIYNRAAVITTLLPELYSQFNISSFEPYAPAVNSLTQTLQEVLIRHFGVLSEEESSILKGLRNPLVWLREGVRWALLLPLSVLDWLGVTSGVAGRASRSRIGKVVAGLVTLLGLLSAVITVFLGWGGFVAGVQKLVP